MEYLSVLRQISHEENRMWSLFVQIYPEEGWKSLWNEWKREGKQSQGKQKQERMH